MSRYRLSIPARRSLESIAAYTEKRWGREQRHKYVDALIYRFQCLAQSPHQGRKLVEISQNFHSYKEGKHIIFYFIRKDSILIVDILHESMDIDTRMERWTQP